MKFSWTKYHNKFGRHGEVITRPWSEWVSILTHHEIRGHKSDANNIDRLDQNKDGPCLILGKIRGTRSDRNVQEVSALALDIEDHSDDEVEAALLPLQNFEYVVHTTHKHGSDYAGKGVRWRVIVPLAHPVSGDEARSVWARLNTMTNFITDQKTGNPSRLIYLPSTFDLSVAESFHHEGRFLELGDLPEAAPTHPTASNDNQEVRVAKLKSKARVLPKKDENRPILEAIFAGEPFAAEGKRHEAVLKATMWLARKDPTLTDETITNIFWESLDTMARTQDGVPSTDEVITAYRGAVDKCRLSAMKPQLRGRDPYSPQQLEEIANTLGVDVDGLERLWIIQFGGSYYFLRGDGSYSWPGTRDDARARAVQELGQAPIMINQPGKNGIRRRPISELVEAYGTCVSKVVASTMIQRSHYDSQTDTFFEATAPRRLDLEPVYDSQIDEWLTLLGGTKHNKLKDWIACVPDTEKLLCALYLAGSASAGKTLLATGLAKIWGHGGPTDLSRVLDDFNEELSRVPVVLADEALPKLWKGNSVTTRLRGELSTMSRTLSRKFKAPVDLRGAIRLILAANNDFLLESSEGASDQDLLAISQRFLHIPVGNKAVKFLKNLPGETKRAWADRGIAEHALHLWKTRQVEEGDRFWVEGSVTQMTRNLITATHWNSRVCEWLVRYLNNPTLYDRVPQRMVQIRAGELWVSDQAIIDSWGVYLPHTKQEPDTRRIGQALASISVSKKRRELGIGKSKVARFRNIDVGHLMAWSDRQNIGDPKAMQDHLDGKKPHDGKPAVTDEDLEAWPVEGEEH